MSEYTFRVIREFEVKIKADSKKEVWKKWNDGVKKIINPLGAWELKYSRMTMYQAKNDALAKIDEFEKQYDKSHL